VRDSCAIVRGGPLSSRLAGAVQGFGQVLLQARQEVAVAIELCPIRSMIAFGWAPSAMRNPAYVCLIIVEPDPIGEPGPIV
jgi:hypothetical protein